MIHGKYGSILVEEKTLCCRNENLLSLHISRNQVAFVTFDNKKYLPITSRLTEIVATNGIRDNY